MQMCKIIYNSVIVNIIIINLIVLYTEIAIFTMELAFLLPDSMGRASVLVLLFSWCRNNSFALKRGKEFLTES